MEENIIINFHWMKKNESFDIEVPISITGNELILGLNQGLGLEINENNISQLYLKATNPITLIKGNKTLEEFRIYNGTDIWFDR